MEMNGKITVNLPEDEHERPWFTVTTPDGAPLFGFEVSPEIIEGIYRWRQRQYDLQDIDNFIAEIEAGEANVIARMTAEKMRQYRDEILSSYQEIRDDRGDWADWLECAIQSVEWNHREKKTYWKCPTDQYGQRTGDVFELQLADWEYEKRRKHEFLYDSYEAALAAAQD